MNKKLKEYILSQQISTHDEDRLGLPHSKPISKEQMLKEWEDASNKQLIKDRENALLWEEEYRKRRAWEEDHWVETEGGDGYYNSRKIT